MLFCVSRSEITEKWKCSRSVRNVDSIAMPTEPPRLRMMLKIAEPAVCSRYDTAAADSDDSGP
jgi:hypothetical protein